jgi:hypothetical protein
MRDTLPGNVMFGFNTTVGSYNLLEIDQVCLWFEQNIQTNREGDLSDFCWQLATNFDPMHASAIIKQQAIQQMEPFAILLGLVNYLRKTMNNTENSIWIDTLNKIDSKRGTNWKTALNTAKFIKETTC